MGSCTGTVQPAYQKLKISHIMHMNLLSNRNYSRLQKFDKTFLPMHIISDDIFENGRSTREFMQ